MSLPEPSPKPTNQTPTSTPEQQQQQQQPLQAQQDKLSNLEVQLQKALSARRKTSTLRNLTLPSPTSTDFSSNDFLSLSSSPTLRQLFLSQLSLSPNFPTGSGGSRLLDGNSTYAESLERSIATFHNAPCGLLCNSGFDANAGLFSVLPQRGDYVVYDGYIHASVWDGMRASRAGKLVAFEHNDVLSLRTVLVDLLAKDEELKAGRRNVFVAVEAIYSMDGDVAPLTQIVETVEGLLTKGNGHIVVDEAHSTGVLGPQGRGLVSALGLEDKITIRLHTFGKAMACNGAIILCTPLIKHYLLNYARPLIYTTFLSFPSLALIHSSYTLLRTPLSTTLVTSLFTLIRHLHTLLLSLYTIIPVSCRHLLQVPDTCPPSPIFSILSSDPRGLAGWCQKGGMLVRPIVPPTVPVGKERIRVCLHAGNSGEEVERLVQRIGAWVKGKVEGGVVAKL